MAISTLANLETQVLSFLSKAQLLDTVGADNVDNLIALGELWIFRKARTPEMESSLSVTIASGVATVPTDYLEMKYSYIDGSPTQPLKMRPSQWILNQYPTRSADNKPFFIARDGSNFIFGPYPDSAYTVKGTYYAKPTSIETSANTLFTTNPDLYLYAALAEAEAYIKEDTRIAFWITKRDQILLDVNNQATNSEHSGPQAAVVM